MRDHPSRRWRPSMFPTLDRAVLRAWLTRTWVGRLLVAGLGTKLVVSLAGLVSAGLTARFGALDRAANLALAAAGLCLLFRLIGAIRRRLLWSVRNRLVLLYVLIGVVPILLLGTFAAVGIVLLFFNISSYLVQNRLDGLTREASVLARRVLVEVEQAPQAGWDGALTRRAAAAASRYPGAAYAIVPTSGRPPCGVTGSAPGATPPAVSAVRPRHAGSWARVDPPAVLPRWVTCSGFAGVVAYPTRRVRRRRRPPAPAGARGCPARGGGAPVRGDRRPAGRRVAGRVARTGRGHRSRHAEPDERRERGHAQPRAGPTRPAQVPRPRPRRTTARSTPPRSSATPTGSAARRAAWRCG